MAFIEVRDLCYSYDEGEQGRNVLNGVNFTVEKGEFVAILGHNGSGKSTLAKLLTMVLCAKSGDIMIDGVKLMPDMPDEEVIRLRRKMGIVFQNPDDQLVASVVEEDIAFGPENLGIEPSEIRKRVDKALDAVKMTEYAHHAPNRLSGGQKQRIAIAGVLAIAPECIVFDESTAMLDPSGREGIMRLIKEINKSGITVICITHYMSEAALADRIIVLDRGRIYMQGTPNKVFKDPEKLKEVHLELPSCAQIAQRIREAGIDIGEDILDCDSLVEAVDKLIKANN